MKSFKLLVCLFVIMFSSQFIWAETFSECLEDSKIKGLEVVEKSEIIRDCIHLHKRTQSISANSCRAQYDIITGFSKDISDKKLIFKIEGIASSSAHGCGTVAEAEIEKSSNYSSCLDVANIKGLFEQEKVNFARLCVSKHRKTLSYAQCEDSRSKVARINKKLLKGSRSERKKRGTISIGSNLISIAERCELVLKRETEDSTSLSECTKNSEIKTLRDTQVSDIIRSCVFKYEKENTSFEDCQKHHIRVSSLVDKQTDSESWKTRKILNQNARSVGLSCSRIIRDNYSFSDCRSYYDQIKKHDAKNSVNQGRFGLELDKIEEICTKIRNNKTLEKRSSGDVYNRIKASPPKLKRSKTAQ